MDRLIDKHLLKYNKPDRIGGRGSLTTLVSPSQFEQIISDLDQIIMNVFALLFK